MENWGPPGAPGWQNTWRHQEWLDCWLLWVNEGLSPQEGCSPGDTVRIREMEGQTPGTETLNSPGDQSQCAMGVIFVALTQGCVWPVTLDWANKYLFLAGWVTSYTSSNCRSSITRTHRWGRGGLTLLLLLLSTSILVRVLKYPYPSSSTSAYRVHAFVWKHLQGSNFSPCPPHKSWFGRCYFPAFRGTCSNTLGSVCGPGGDRVAFCFTGVNTDPFVLNSLEVLLLMQSLSLDNTLR